MAHDDIPEDEEVSYPCDCGGSITENRDTGAWACDTCGSSFPAEDISGY